MHLVIPIIPLSVCLEFSMQSSPRNLLEKDLVIKSTKVLLPLQTMQINYKCDFYKTPFSLCLHAKYMCSRDPMLWTIICVCTYSLCLHVIFWIAFSAHYQIRFTRFNVAVISRFSKQLTHSLLEITHIHQVRCNNIFTKLRNTKTQHLSSLCVAGITSSQLLLLLFHCSCQLSGDGRVTCLIYWQ